MSRLDPEQTASQAPYVAGTLWKVNGDPYWIDPKGPRDFDVRPLQLVEIVNQVAP